MLRTRDGGDLRCYLCVGDQVFETYETKWRGIEAMLPTLQLLDLTAYGRQETWEDSPAGWPQDDTSSFHLPPMLLVSTQHENQKESVLG